MSELHVRVWGETAAGVTEPSAPALVNEQVNHALRLSARCARACACALVAVRADLASPCFALVRICANGTRDFLHCRTALHRVACQPMTELLSKARRRSTLRCSRQSWRKSVSFTEQAAGPRPRPRPRPRTGGEPTRPATDPSVSSR
jgi:hypothetical protein